MMEVDEDFGGSAKKAGRTLTPQQRHVSAQQKHRSLTQSRREGSTPARLPYKPVPEEHVRLAKKITKKAFRTNLFSHEADRAIQTKMPRHLFVGKMDGGSSNKR